MKGRKTRKSATDNRSLMAFEQASSQLKESFNDAVKAKEPTDSEIALRKLFAERKVLAKKEQLELIERAPKGDLKARDLLFQQYRGLVKRCARRWRGFDVDDLEQAGAIGMLKAIESFDKSKNASFSTFATICIKQSISDQINECRSCIRLPKYIRTDARKIDRYAQEFALTHGREATAEEIALNFLLNSKEFVQKIRDWASREIKSLEFLFSDEGVFDIDADCLLIGQLPEPEAIAKENALTKFVARMLKGVLNPREIQVIILRHGLVEEEPLTLAEIGRRLKLSEQRVWQIEDAALQKLKASRFSDKAKSFLD